MKQFYALFLIFLFSGLTHSQIIITELADPNNDYNARFVEIYNISDSAVDLTGWTLQRWTNGNLDPTSSAEIDLSSLGNFESGAIAVIGKSAFESVYGFAPNIVSSNSAVDSNGDDQVAIFDANGNVIDIFGVPGEDGTGTCHEFEDGRAERKASVTASQATWNEAEWNVWADSTVSGCTTHVNAPKNAPDDYDPGSWIGASSEILISLISPADNTVFPPGTTSVEISFSTVNAPAGSGVDVVINPIATFGDAVSPFSVTVADGTSYTIEAILYDNGTVVATDNASFSVGSYNQTSDIVGLRTATAGDFYELSGEAVITYVVTDNTRNQKYIQDQSGGILIDDPDGVLTTQFNIGDGIVGLKGQLSSYSGVTQFIPTENVASASSTGNTITPQTISIADFISPANADLYESQLIRFENVTFTDTGNFAHNQNYSISQGTDATTLRVTFNDEDLIGASIPSVSDYVIGLAAEFNGSLQILPRYINDVQGALSTNDYGKLDFELYPNPTSSGFVTIKTNQVGVVQAQVFDLLGKEVLKTSVNNERMDVSNLNAGVYVVKLLQNNNTTTKKLIIQ
ncbi:MAG: T9SS type A sorting domain-containing protein [Flavobacteriaceae bacterium]